MNEELKPLKECPFCGGIADIHVINYIKFWANVYCTDCDATTIRYSTKQQAIKAWNRRV